MFYIIFKRENENVITKLKLLNLLIIEKVNLDSISEALSANLQIGGEGNATVTKWHVLHQCNKRKKSDENGFCISKTCLPRSQNINGLLSSIFAFI